jgi:hypothetical protein
MQDVQTYVEENWDRWMMEYGSDFQDESEKCIQTVIEWLTNEYQRKCDEEWDRNMEKITEDLPLLREAQWNQ